MPNLFDPDTESSNDRAFVNLDEGKHAYRITSMTLTQKGNGIQGGFVRLDTGKRHTHYFGIFEGEPTGRIAKGDMKALWDAAGLTGKADLDRLPNFVDKVVEIDVFKNTGKEGQVFTNIRAIHPYNGTAPESKFNQPEDKDDELPGLPAKSEPPAAAAAPASTPKKWKDRLKK